tara:strand:+ start:99 stop:215 length:117 start_codon:yes stop_codon:yes gene_type:complete
VVVEVQVEIDTTFKVVVAVELVDLEKSKVQQHLTQLVL